MLSRPDGFMLYGKFSYDFFSTSELLYPNMKSWLQLFGDRPNFYIISDNPNVCSGNVDCSLHIRQIALKVEYHKKRMDMLENIPVDLNCLETLANTSTNPARQNQFIQESVFENASFRPTSIAKKTNSAFIGSYTGNPFWHEKFDLRENRILR